MAIEPDLAESLRRRAQRDGTSFKAALNAALRTGLQRDDRPSRGSFVQRSSLMGLRADVDLTRINRMIDDLEDAELEQRR